MTIKRNVQLPRSNRMGVKPRADELEFGMLAVNYAAGDEFLSTKNSEQKVVVFPSKNYIEKHPFSSLTIDNLAVNSGASISGNTIIDGGLKVSGDTYLGGRTYLKSGNNLVAIENFITETANAGANNYVTGGTAANNTITLKRKGLADAVITDVVTKDKVAEEVVAASNGKFVHTTGDTITGTLKFTHDDAIKIELDDKDNYATIGGGSTALHITADDIDLLGTSEGSKNIYINPQNGEISLNKIDFDGSSSIQNLTGETSSKTKLNITAGDEHLYYNGNPIANLADSLWEAGEGNGAVLLKGSNGSALGEFSVSEGKDTTANGTYSHAEGNHTIAMNEGEHACGSYNRSASGSGQVFSVGVGTSNDNRVNSFYVKNDGTVGSDLDMSISGNSKITLSTSSDKLIMSAGTLTTNCTMTTGAYFTTSDKRLKTNIINVTEDEIEKAKKVDLKSFNLKRDGKKHFGVVAQEVEAAGLAELVNTDSEGMKSVDYTSLLILKIAELEKEIKDLKNQINNK